eukprot:COSAG02_NODE_41084_length_398_cov_0.956522_1_plen_22_part_10
MTQEAGTLNRARFDALEKRLCY